MGRPLNKRYFGNPDLPGKQLVLDSVWLDDTGLETGYWVVRQVGTGRYQVTNGTKVGVVRLVGQMPEVAGEANILVVPFGSSTAEHARIIYNRTVSTWELNNYRWTTEDATAEGEATLPWGDADEEPYTEEEAIGDMNGAADADEVVALIEAHPETFMTPEAFEDFETLTPSSRRNSVGLGVKEWEEIFGPYEDIEFLRETIALHTDMEKHKDDFVKAVDAASTTAAMKTAYETFLEPVVIDRDNLIVWLRDQNVPAATDRADELEVDDFTVILSEFRDEVVAGLVDAAYTDILDQRNELSGSKFYGFGRMLPVLQVVLDELDGDTFEPNLTAGQDGPDIGYKGPAAYDVVIGSMDNNTYGAYAVVGLFDSTPGGTIAVMALEGNVTGDLAVTVRYGESNEVIVEMEKWDDFTHNGNPFSEYRAKNAADIFNFAFDGEYQVVSIAPIA